MCGCVWVGGCMYNAYWVSGQRAHHYRELTVSCELRGERGSTITELMATLERWQVGGGGGGGKLRYSLNYPRCAVLVIFIITYLLELETKVHPKVRNHGKGPY